jgi:hypothetical protein
VTQVAQPDRAMLAWQARGTLEQWRAADRVLRRTEDPAASAAPERAVAVALTHLDRFSSVDELVAHWRVDRYRRLSDPGEPRSGTVEAWARDACRVEEGATPADEEIVAGAALWRRARALMGQTPD